MGMCAWECVGVNRGLSGADPPPCPQCLPLQDLLSSSFAPQFRGRVPKHQFQRLSLCGSPVLTMTRLQLNAPLTGCRNTGLHVSRHAESVSFVLCPAGLGLWNALPPWASGGLPPILPWQSTAVLGLKPGALGSDPGSSSQHPSGSSVWPHSVFPQGLWGD